MRTLTICGRPIADYTIVLKPVPAPAETTAAEFLQRVIASSCGVTLPISDHGDYGIYIGTRESCSEVRWDGFRITTDDKNVYLDGNIPRGTLYAAYDFAEKHLGYRIFAPDCEVISTEGAAEVPAGLDHVDNPGMEARRTGCYVHKSFPEFAAHSRMNDCMPGLDEPLGGCTGITGACHTFSSYLNGSTYFADHPEYYALVNGERIPCNTGAGPGQLCLTNPDVLRIVTEKVLDDLRAHPQKTVVDVSQADNGNYCTCEACTAIAEREGSQSGPVICFVNAIAEAVEKEFPNAKIQTFAYSYSRTPPKHVKPRENVIIRYCPLEACFRHGINDPDCPTNAIFREEMERWGKIASHMSIWDYLAGWNCYITPFPNLISMRENMGWFADCNVHYILGDCNHDAAGGAYPELKAYMYGKLLWNPHMSEETYRGHIAEFLRAYYGRGWREIGRYIALEYEVTAGRCFLGVEEIDICAVHYMSDPPLKGLKPYLRYNFEPGPFMPQLPDHALLGLVARMDEARGYYDRALAMAETEGERLHIARSRMAIDYLDLFCSGKEESTLSAEEKKTYLEQVKKFKEDKVKYNFYWNLYTGNFQGR